MVFFEVLRQTISSTPNVISSFSHCKTILQSLNYNEDTAELFDLLLDKSISFLDEIDPNAPNSTGALTVFISMALQLYKKPNLKKFLDKAIRFVSVLVQKSTKSSFQTIISMSAVTLPEQITLLHHVFVTLNNQPPAQLKDKVLSVKCTPDSRESVLQKELVDYITNNSN
ncbi:hypothetical protein QTN25_001963 [Entamoeba marina]